MSLNQAQLLIGMVEYWLMCGRDEIIEGVGNFSQFKIDQNAVLMHGHP